MFSKVKQSLRVFRDKQGFYRVGGRFGNYSNNIVKHMGVDSEAHNIVKHMGVASEAHNIVKHMGVDSEAHNIVKLMGVDSEAHNIVKHMGVDSEAHNIVKHMGVDSEAHNIVKHMGVDSEAHNIVKLMGVDSEAHNIVKLMGVDSEAHNIVKHMGVDSEAHNIVKHMGVDSEAHNIVKHMGVDSEAHNIVKLMGVASTLNEIRQTSWICKGTQIIKRHLMKCVICKRNQGKVLKGPEAPDLPKYRLSTEFAFQTTGLDFAGPLFDIETKYFVVSVSILKRNISLQRCYSHGYGRLFFMIIVSVWGNRVYVYYDKHSFDSNLKYCVNSMKCSLSKKNYKFLKDNRQAISNKSRKTLQVSYVCFATLIIILPLTMSSLNALLFMMDITTDNIFFKCIVVHDGYYH